MSITAVELKSCWLLVPTDEIKYVALNKDREAESIQYQGRHYPKYRIDRLLNPNFNRPSRFVLLLAGEGELGVAMECQQMIALEEPPHLFDLQGWYMPKPQMATKVAQFHGKCAYLTDFQQLLTWMEHSIESNNMADPTDSRFANSHF